MHPKAKPITVAGLSLSLAPLTMRQIETLVDSVADETVAQRRDRLWKQIETSLHNADPAQPSIEELKDQLDFGDWLAVVQHMREVSHLTLA